MVAGSGLEKDAEKKAKEEGVEEMDDEIHHALQKSHPHCLKRR